MKRIGIVGGLSPESTILYYNHIVRKYYEIKHDHYFPEIVIYSLSFQEFSDAVAGNKKHAVALLIKALKTLEKAGAEVAGISANTPHIYFDDIAGCCGMEIISILDATLERAVENSFNKLLLLGTMFTMKSGMFEKKFKAHGIEILTPDEEDMRVVNSIIMNELAHGEVKDESKDRITSIIEKYDVDATILGCTELPMLFEEDKKIKFLDTAKIHAEKILKKAMEEEGAHSL